MTDSVSKPGVPSFWTYVLGVSPAALDLTASLNMNYEKRVAQNGRYFNRMRYNISWSKGLKQTNQLTVRRYSMSSERRCSMSKPAMA